MNAKLSMATKTTQTGNKTFMNSELCFHSWVILYTAHLVELVCTQAEKHNEVELRKLAKEHITQLQVLKPKCKSRSKATLTPSYGTATTLYMTSLYLLNIWKGIENIIIYVQHHSNLMVVLWSACARVQLVQVNITPFLSSFVSTCKRIGNLIQ